MSEIGLGVFDCGGEWVAECDLGSDGGGERAASAMGAWQRDAGGVVAMNAGGIGQEIQAIITFEVTAFDEKGTAVTLPKDDCGVFDGYG